jgi:glutamine synthetase
MTPTGATEAEAQAFLDAHDKAQAIDIVLTDAHGIGRGKSIRRHELLSLYRGGRGMPVSLFAQDVAGEDVEAAGIGLTDGADMRCWPVPGTLGFNPATGRGQVLVSMFDAGGVPVAAEPRHALMAQVARAAGMGFQPQGALELEFYLVQRGEDGRVRPAAYALTGRKSPHRNTMSVDEIDEMAPLFDAVYAGAAALGLPLESLISEYAPGQYEFTLRHGPLARACDEVISAKRLIRSTARRFGMEACFMAKPFGEQSGSGMHLHLSLNDAEGRNVFADTADGALSPMMLHAIGGVRATVGRTMLVLAPFLNSWRRLAATVYSPASDTWGVENRTVALRVPAGAPATRHFEHRVAGVDANPYLVAAVTLAAALDGIEAGHDPGPPVTGSAYDGPPSTLLRDWLSAIEAFEASDFCRRALGDPLHAGFAAVKRAEWRRLALTVTEAEWELYGFTV